MLASARSHAKSQNMQHTAYLSRPAVEIGASLIIAGNQLATGDNLDIVTSDHKSFAVAVAAFGLARLVIKTEVGLFECGPWKNDDEPMQPIQGPASRWTVGKLLSASI